MCYLIVVKVSRRNIFVFLIFGYQQVIQKYLNTEKLSIYSIYYTMGKATANSYVYCIVGSCIHTKAFFPTTPSVFNMCCFSLPLKRKAQHSEKILNKVPLKACSNRNSRHRSKIYHFHYDNVNINTACDETYRYHRTSFNCGLIIAFCCLQAKFLIY